MSPSRTLSHISANDAIEAAESSDCFSIHELEANWKNAELGAYAYSVIRETRNQFCTVCSAEAGTLFPYEVTRNHCTYKERACINCLKEFEAR